MKTNGRGQVQQSPPNANNIILHKKNQKFVIWFRKNFTIKRRRIVDILINLCSTIKPFARFIFLKFIRVYHSLKMKVAICVLFTFLFGVQAATNCKTFTLLLVFCIVFDLNKFIGLSTFA